MQAQIAADEVEALRPLLFGIGYRLLGSAAEAEDLVQDAYLRYWAARGKGPDDVRSPRAYLTTVVTRLGLDRLKSARARRETYIGPWLPEPILADAELPAEAAERHELLSLASLVLLERLTPAERAVFVLREAVGYDFAEIGHVLGRAAPACRQLFHRARERVAAGAPRFAASADAQRRLTERFARLCESGDVQGLAALLAEDAVALTDGGGKARAALRPIVGRERVVRFLFGILAKGGAEVGGDVGEATFAPLNGGWGILVWQAGRLADAVWLDGSDEEGIRAVHIVANPDKLAYLARQLGRG